jgi:flagellar biosynthesis protein FlhA
MATQTQAFPAGARGAFDAVRDYLKNGEIALAAGILGILVILLLPLPAWLLDVTL